MTSDMPTIHLCCAEGNDLYRVLLAGGVTVERYAEPDAALEAAPEHAGVCLLADGYPARGPRFTAELQALQRRKRLRLFVEYPDLLPGVDLGDPQPTRRERVVVASSFFAPAVAPRRILALQGCWYRRAAVDRSPHLVVAKVAGYDHAVFGAPQDAPSILFHTDEQTLVATSSLSGFVTGRYGPKRAWRAVWRAILAWVSSAAGTTGLGGDWFDWEPVVRTRYGKDAPLPNGCELHAVERAVDWFRGHAVFSIDRKKAAVEGYESGVDHRGRQFIRPIVRGDCTAETAMVLACDWSLTRNPDSRLLAAELLDTIWSSPGFYQSDPASPVYGHTNWTEDNPVFYGDDNARVLLATLTVSRLLGTDRWHEQVLRCVCANWRTTGPAGFRKSRLDLPVLVAERQSWMHYRDTDLTHFAPHYQAYLWAALLWAHALTGYGGFLDRPQRAIRATMARFPNWTWTNGLTQEMARMLLPLAFLLRVAPEPEEHGVWLETILDHLLADAAPCGTIRERLGASELGRYSPPRSNEDYGKSEAPVIQRNGDPASDLLYSLGFAFLGLHEAFAATGDPCIAVAEDRLAEFLVRIQTECSVHPHLSGIWMRSFDDEKWEYWGSSADVGWGAFSIEAGWHNAWITAVLAMRQTGDSLFHTGWDDSLGTLFPAILDEMLQERPFTSGAGSTGGAEMPGAEWPAE